MKKHTEEEKERIRAWWDNEYPEEEEEEIEDGEICERRIVPYNIGELLSMRDSI